MKTYEETLEKLRPLIPEEQYIRVMYQPYCELDPGFLGFIMQYEILAGMIPEDWTILDLGCNAAAQSFYFTGHAGYIGVDVLDNREASAEELMSGRIGGTLRFEAENTCHCEKDIKSFTDEDMEKLKDRKVMALCICVPDEAAVKYAFDRLDNIIVFDPENPVLVKTELGDEISKSIAEKLEASRSV